MGFCEVLKKRALYLLINCFVLAIVVEIGAGVVRMGIAARHFVLVYIYLAVVCLREFVVYEVRAKLALRL